MNCIYFTFDYELVLGDVVGSVESCLISSTKAYIELFNKYNVCTTFFIDCAYLLKLKELSELYDNLKTDYDNIVQNIQMLQDNGHSIQYHFHPQWLYSDYIDDKWVLDFDHYKMSDMDESYLKQTFKEGIDLLKSIIGKNIVAFRAGGYSLMSYKNYIQLLKTNDIRIDPSVTAGRRITKLHEYDYTKAPTYTYWRFNDNLLTPDLNGYFHEYRIKAIGPYYSLKYIYLKRMLQKKYSPLFSYNDGLSHINRLNRLKELFLKLFQKQSFHACTDGLMAANLINIYRKSCEENDDMVVIGHPKCTTDASLKLTEKFIQYAKAQGACFKKIDESLLYNQ